MRKSHLKDKIFEPLDQKWPALAYPDGRLKMWIVEPSQTVSNFLVIRENLENCGACISACAPPKTWRNIRNWSQHNSCPPPRPPHNQWKRESSTIFVGWCLGRSKWGGQYLLTDAFEPGFYYLLFIFKLQPEYFSLVYVVSLSFCRAFFFFSMLHDEFLVAIPTLLWWLLCSLGKRQNKGFGHHFNH